MGGDLATAKQKMNDVLKLRMKMKPVCKTESLLDELISDLKEGLLAMSNRISWAGARSSYEREDDGTCQAKELPKHSHTKNFLCHITKKKHGTKNVQEVVNRRQYYGNISKNKHELCLEIARCVFM